MAKDCKLYWSENIFCSLPIVLFLTFLLERLNFYHKDWYLLQRLKSNLPLTFQTLILAVVIQYNKDVLVWYYLTKLRYKPYIKVILYSYLILKKMNECITDS